MCGGDIQRQVRARASSFIFLVMGTLILTLTLTGHRLAVGEDGGCRGFGHVSFHAATDTDKAVKLTGTKLNVRSFVYLSGNIRIGLSS